MAQDDDAGRVKAAARWYAELQGPDAGAEAWAAFRAWERDPRNAAAFRDIERALSALDRSSLAAAAKPAAPARRAALWLGAAAAAAALAALATGAVLTARAPGPDEPAPLVFATAIGEQRLVELEDGSTVTLNTATRIEVAYQASERRVRLEAGQALFEVEPGAAPFVVEAAATLTRALGTSFDVYVRPGAAEVTLLEGEVSVAVPGTAPGGAVVLQPGDRLVVADSAAQSLQKVDLTAALSWRTGILQFKDIRLADAVFELNRYSEIQIELGDPLLGEERLSGSFKAGDPEQFVFALALFLPVEAIRTGDTILISWQDK